ncbi:MAG: hypothetical protein V3V28_12645 [Polaribacter sp.]|uniref:hypothetical protein n=1 Tax=Polaribacter sp. TaxID=1920175 RepID=UPI002F35C71C
MNSSNNLGATLLKASTLATMIFWILMISDSLDNLTFFFFLLSIIPISVICSLTILITITPFFWLENDTISDKEIFKKYFPYYAIIVFVISCYFIIITDFESGICTFFITAFMTLMQSWTWICKTPVIQKNKLK